MSVKKFITDVKNYLGLDDFKKSGKKKSIKRLLEKLRSRKEILDKTPRKNLNKKELKALKEEQAIITLQIKKGEKILDELNAESHKDSKKLKGEKNGKK